ncbi:uncharacterized protein LMH87_007691 [Akanthomyces muscarius]|uniref:Uncharacterized protein n=1 Tax=Akanthomyces muscarius TaxID=2231603 RepID=A0A9W8URJ6_AKAMU|nr:uncharacterized protein LMH87_007691 [Akanthomyces muscarius]KAJ4161665.1 hypothetical protein LMH87_007691 [Akanthomyces muscarius]
MASDIIDLVSSSPPRDAKSSRRASSDIGHRTGHGGKRPRVFFEDKWASKTSPDDIEVIGSNEVDICTMAKSSGRILNPTNTQRLPTNALPSSFPARAIATSQQAVPSKQSSSLSKPRSAKSTRRSKATKRSCNCN